MNPQNEQALNDTRTWVVDEANGLSELEMRLNHLQGLDRSHSEQLSQLRRWPRLAMFNHSGPMGSYRSPPSLTTPHERACRLLPLFSPNV